jgi:osmoprotectant transport system permease protein
MYNALQSGEADVISAYTSDGRIAADKLVVLADPKGALPSYDAMLMLSPRIAEDEGVIAALEPLIGAITVEAMREANLAVDREDGQKQTPKAAAAELARKAGL